MFYFFFYFLCTIFSSTAEPDEVVMEVFGENIILSSQDLCHFRTKQKREETTAVLLMTVDFMIRV